MSTPRYVVEATKTERMTYSSTNKEAAVRYAVASLGRENTTSITITKRCESEESSASDAT